MDTQQYIAEHLDPMDTAGGWGSGEAFADAILEYADGELPVTRADLIEYWRQARRKAEASRLERTPLQVRVEYGPRSNRGTAIVTLSFSQPTRREGTESCWCRWSSSAPLDGFQPTDPKRGY